MRNFIKYLAVLPLGLFILIGCGGGGGGTPANNNTTPIADAGTDQTMRLGAGDITLDGTASNDPDGTSLTYLWEFLEVPFGSGATLLSLDTAMSSFTPDVAGTYRVQLTVNDGTTSASDFAIISIDNNTQPVANPGSNQRIVFGSGMVALDGNSSNDLENDPLTFVWEIIQAPTGSTAALMSTDTADSSFLPDIVGTYRIQLTVSDGILNHAAIVDIDVANNTLPTARAGVDINVNRGGSVQLSGNASTDPDGQGLTFTWTQLSNQCPDVTGGSGVLTGMEPRLTAPSDVCTLAFDLRVNDGMGDSMADRIYVHVMEDRRNALFVDRVNGDDGNPGTRQSPLQTIQVAINAAETDGNGADVYIRQGDYRPSGSSLQLVDGISLYGGYGTNWERDTTRYVSTIRGLYGRNDGNLTIDGFTIIGNNGGNAIPVFFREADGVRISNNNISSGTAGTGANGTNGTAGAAGGDGGTGRVGSCDGAGTRAGGSVGTGAASGGSGGYGGQEGSNNGYWGSNGNGLLGGPGGSGGQGGDPGRAGSTGVAGGSGENGINGSQAAQLGVFGSNGYFLSAATSGSSGTAGSGGGGGGGGGGQGCFFCDDGAGNGGGGGGGGGYPGAGGTRALSGYASIGIYLYAMTNTEVINNTITAGTGGSGGNGSSGGVGGAGGSGGTGASLCTSEVGRGGTGGAGGRGGDGGDGGAGAGGPSIGIAHQASATNITIDGNTIDVATPSSGGSPNGYQGVSATIYQY